MEKMCQKGKIGKTISEKKAETTHTTAEEWAKASQKRRMTSDRVFNRPLSISVSH
jgi:hypothetical protein